MTHTIAALLENRPSRFIYTSSTGVYGDYSNGWVDESSLRRAKHPAGARLIETEDTLFTAVEEAQFPGWSSGSPESTDRIEFPDAIKF